MEFVGKEFETVVEGDGRFCGEKELDRVEVRFAK